MEEEENRDKDKILEDSQAKAIGVRDDSRGLEYLTLLKWKRKYLKWTYILGVSAGARKTR